MYDKVILTNLPSFYKINLYNRFSEYERILVLYTGDTAEERNKDFFSGTMQFDHLYFSQNKLLQLAQLLRIFVTCDYRELIIGGWDSVTMWEAALISSKSRKSLVIESTDYESTMTGIKKILKTFFLSRFSKVYASGKAQKRLAERLGFRGQILITKGVGIFNYIEQPLFETRSEVRSFIFVGRLVPVKNLKLLIDVFNKMPEKQLTIVGFGEQEEFLKSMAKENIAFMGAVDNNRLPQIYQQHDVFILPSISEVWGLVVEEALNNGLPVLLSNRVGCVEEIVIDGENGLIFRYDDPDDLIQKIRQISNVELYNRMRLNISQMNFGQIEREQVKCYCPNA
jgi:wffZ